jgi:enterochelin esterase-like enzyme
MSTTSRAVDGSGASPVEDLEALLAPERWEPLPRPTGAEAPTPVHRVDEDRAPEGSGAEGEVISRPDTGDEPVSRSEAGPEAVSRPGAGPEVLSRSGATALVRFRHHAPSASAVALHASGWWRPEPVDACDLRPTGEGWWEGIFEVPSDWRASYGFAVHDGPGDPPWWQAGLKQPGAEVVADAGARRGHRAARGGAARSVIALAEDGPFGCGPPTGEPAPALHDLDSPGIDEPVRGWVARPGDPGCEQLRGDEPLPLLILTDGAQHADLLGTPQRLRRGVAAGLLPPLAAVFVDSGTRRGEMLGVPGGHARWIAETLVPRLQAEGLAHPDGPVPITADPSRVVVAGSSFGGLTALFTAARAPHRVGAAIAQSVSLWRYPEGSLAAPLLAAARRAAAEGAPLRLILQAGRFEGAMHDHASALLGTVLEAAEREQVPLEARLDLCSGGHDWAWWQPEMLTALAALLR